MPGDRTKRVAGLALRYAFASTLGLLTAAAALTGLQWYWCAIAGCTAVILILGKRRIFRPGITRTSEEIVCRYVPWYEGNAYVLTIALPLIGAAMVAAGYAPPNPTWLRYGGFILLGLTPLMVFSVVSMWRRCVVRITSDALIVRLATGDPIDIAHDLVDSITPRTVPNGVSGQSPRIQIAYRSGDLSADATKTVLLGPQVSVQPTNLLAALAAWKEACGDDRSHLLDRIEPFLRGRSTAS